MTDMDFSRSRVRTILESGASNGGLVTTEVFDTSAGTNFALLSEFTINSGTITFQLYGSTKTNPDITRAKDWAAITGGTGTLTGSTLLLDVEEAGYTHAYLEFDASLGDVQDIETTASIKRLT